MHNHSQKDIYQQTCQKCHGKYANGNKKRKAPSLKTLSYGELDVAIFQLDFDIHQSSGTTCEKVGYRLKDILKKDMKIQSKELAKYILSL